MIPPNYRTHETDPQPQPLRHESEAAWTVNRTLGGRVDLVDFHDGEAAQVYVPLTVSDGSMGRATGLYLAPYEAEVLAAELIAALRAANERRKPRAFRRNQAEDRGGEQE
ncbi:hypothetical protein [Streptomyces yaizuensis]|uniref:Uncharacterized protein n=1 Tax=Streptomyces yaizuensis TaxID=2989713 RepID=A0ABQ5P9T2_9ACTN|nr:hypothetical protein [Streptomyces sp. YSPA8]GLF99248.1 hypothetical protein SYYSPA8_33145 [Streptomyces sp. YSPA8]